MRPRDRRSGDRTLRRSVGGGGAHGSLSTEAGGALRYSAGFAGNAHPSFTPMPVNGVSPEDFAGLTQTGTISVKSGKVREIVRVANVQGVGPVQGVGANK